MTIADPRTYQVETISFDECDVCEHVNRVTYWEDSRTHRWERDAFDCINCGEHHRAIDGTAEDRGATTVLWSLVWLGVLMVAAPLVHLFTAPAAPWHALTIIAGIALIVGVFTVGVLARLHQKGIDQ